MEENLAYEELELNKEGQFIIDNDTKAEWALEKIKEEKQEMERLIEVCEKKIQEYKQKIEMYQKRYEQRTSYLKSLLNQYFLCVPHRKTKTQEVYDLPGGKLKLKFQGPEIVKDEEVLLTFLEQNGYNDFIVTKKLVSWAELKSTLKISGDKAITPDGVILEGIKIVERSPVFDVEVR